MLLAETSNDRRLVLNQQAAPTMYYADKIPILKNIFGADAVGLDANGLTVDGILYPIMDDVIVCLDPADWPATLQARHSIVATEGGHHDIAKDIQYTFGEEWRTFRSLLPDHESAFRQYFDLIDLSQLAQARLCDLGCGMGRWSYFASQYCREIVLVDFSEAIFVAREVMRDRRNAIFVMADVRRLPFTRDFADLIFCLGVLHHLPSPALQEVISLRRYGRELLVYLYYALDNRPAYFQFLLSLVTPVRRLLAKLRGERVRHSVAVVIAGCVYLPLIGLGVLMKLVKLESKVPLYEAYHDKSLATIIQDAYDRFFTPIEQRVTRRAIEGLGRDFERVIISDQGPYWHFRCIR